MRFEVENRCFLWEPKEIASGVFLKFCDGDGNSMAEVLRSQRICNWVSVFVCDCDSLVVFC